MRPVGRSRGCPRNCERRASGRCMPLTASREGRAGRSDPRARRPAVVMCPRPGGVSGGCGRWRRTLPVGGRSMPRAALAPPVAATLVRASNGRIAHVVTVTSSTADRAPPLAARTSVVLQALLAAASAWCCSFGVGFVADRGGAQRGARHAALARLSLPLTRRGETMPVFRSHRLHRGPRRAARRPAADLAQQLGTVPLILQAEVYEQAPPPRAATPWWRARSRQPRP